jgi:folate-dependent phosphoribosylglycinamide formyltransferase PurN
LKIKKTLKSLLKKNKKGLAFFTVVGQILFQILISNLLICYQKTTKEIINENLLDLTEIPKDKIKFVTSVNSETTIALLKAINPDLVIVNGTRIISKKVLSSINSKFVNIHVGITPKYRGVHGTYWALVNNDVENSGVTVHFVDEGIDTGI